jgi:hypothetical protein
MPVRPEMSIETAACRMAMRPRILGWTCGVLISYGGEFGVAGHVAGSILKSIRIFWPQPRLIDRLERRVQSATAFRQLVP